jgi:uncharacterized protein YukE
VADHIRVQTEDLAAHSAQLRQIVSELETVLANFAGAAQNLESHIQTVGSKVKTLLGESWQSSQASGAYADLHSNWDSRAQKIHQALEDLLSQQLNPMKADLDNIGGRIMSASQNYDDSEAAVKSIFA